jgi:hypothetical protein
MNKIVFFLLALLMFSVDALGDIAPGRSVPKPTSTPATTVTPRTTPAVAPNEARMAISVSRYEDEATLVITKSMIEKINAALKAKGEKAMIAEAAPEGIASTQTIVGGLFLSLALVFGGVWLARSGGTVSKPALGIVVFAVVGMAATLVIGNVPPPRRVPLSEAVNEKLEGLVASGKVKIMLVDYQTQEDIMLVLPKKPQPAGATEK